MKRNSELPDEEGTVFVAYSANAPFQILGRRGLDGQLYVGALLSHPEQKPSLEEFRATIRDGDSCTGVPMEIVVGEEAESLFGEFEWHPIH
jgi:hypothetical protein